MDNCPLCGAVLREPRIHAPDRLHGTPGAFAVAECSGCAAGVTLPAAAPEELERFYPQGYGPYARPGNPIVAVISAAIRWWQGALAWRRPPLQALHGRSPGRGLDVGAGRGDLSAMLGARGWRMTAVEPSADAVVAASARGIDARQGVLGTVELEPQGYDLAVFQHSLEHTPDPAADLRRASSLLRPGGLILISVPNFGSWQRRRFGGAWYHLDLPRHRVHFTGAALERALREAGFVEVALYRSSSAVGLAASLQYLVVGRCMFPEGLRLRVAAGLCAATLPVTAALDLLLGEGDTLHAVARRPG